ncbi:MAG: hypothetical protein JNM56_38950 [Planctomycetia bacterium]|nr:hypothetical protein [Planctomycetia bacterium]
MKSFLTCAFGILALGFWTVPVQAGEPAVITLTGCCQGGGCGHGGCGHGGCGYKSVTAASCCEDDCCKPSCWAKLKDRLFGRTVDCCEPACAPKCDACDSCKPSWRDKMNGWFKKNDCCEPVCEKKCDTCDPCCEKKKFKFNFSFKKKNDCCNDCGAIHVEHAAPAKVEPKAAEPEKIGLPMPKDEMK